MIYPTDLNECQRKFILDNFPEIFKTKSKDSVIDILQALFYLVKTGCQWRMIPKSYPKWRKVYNFFRKWSDQGIFVRLMLSLNTLAREKKHKPSSPTVAIIDSETTRSALPHSTKGIDGGKKVKGIKRHVAVDSNGFPPAVVTTTGNIHDSKAAHPLICKTSIACKSIRLIKADMGYSGALSRLLPVTLGISLQCIKSNFGTSDFKPIDGRWVVERTFSWLTSFRRLCRNYEQHLHTARSMAEAACAMFMLRFCR